MTESSIRSAHYLPGLNRVILESEKEKPMNRKLSLSQIIKFLGAILLILTPLSAQATKSFTIPPTKTPFCACCADMGMWELESRKIYDSEIEILNTLRLDGVALFYITPGWPDDVFGVSPPVDDLDQELVISIVREQQNWKLFFKTKAGRAGALILTMTGKATFFNADIGEGPRPERRNPISIYKEIRLEGAVRGTGIFAKGIAPKANFRLVLQGRGNRCLTVEDLQRWSLRISGPQAGYTIYGYFAKSVS